MATCVPTRSWVWYERAWLGASFGGGVLLLTAAAAAHDGASIPMLIAGAAWSLIGLFAWWQRRRLVREIRLEDGVITLVSPMARLSVPAQEIIRIRRRRNSFRPLQLRTAHNGTIRLVPQMKGLLDLLVELRQLNTEARFPDY